MTEMDRLGILFEEIGARQRATDEQPLEVAAKKEILDRVLEAQILLPPGNEHIWDDFRLWIMRSWAVVLKRYGDDAAEPWRVFLVEVNEMIGVRS
ncbi:hypothetical protein [Amycolatopsis sp. CA-230715]|uniref:hypothetical protein n=1 Tax=Amycolatopsis sp. CA-230715 TaxID=2745196 RepID=UPI001C01E43A|nr:hypothetical protein [Amycolatopsis sp. CA-230715]